MLLSSEKVQKAMCARTYLSPGFPRHAVRNRLGFVSSWLLLGLLLFSLACLIVITLAAKLQAPEWVLEAEQQSGLSIAVRRLTPAVQEG